MKYFLILFLSLGMISCDKDDDQSEEESTACEGSEELTMENLTGLLDGCGWVLNRADGTRVEPTNLGDFTIVLEDGKLVNVTYDLEPNAVSICLVGNIVTITCIEE